MSLDRFDLEQGIMRCWNVTEDIDLLYRSVMEGNMTKDDISNVLLGLKCLYDLKFQETWNNFETLVGDGKIV